MIPPDWLWGLAGGLMIGCAAALFLLMNGRIMGASGILGGLEVEAVPFADATPERQIGIAWRRGTGRADEYRLLGDKLTRLWLHPEPSG